MKYSFMSFSAPELSLSELFETATKYGYDAIEPRLDSKHAHGIEVDTTPEQRKAILAQVAASEIELSCLATSLTYANPENTEKMIKDTHERIDLAGDLSVPTIRVFGGVIPEGLEREEAIALVVDSLTKVADHAAKRNVILCIETHDHWCDPNNVATIIQQVNHPAICVNWDIMHPVRVEDVSITDSFNILKPWIKHVHVHDGDWTEALKMVPIGTGGIDHKTAIQLLEKMEYSGYISGEWINWEDYKLHLPREIATMKSYEKN